MTNEKICQVKILCPPPFNIIIVQRKKNNWWKLPLRALAVGGKCCQCAAITLWFGQCDWNEWKRRTWNELAGGWKGIKIIGKELEKPGNDWNGQESRECFDEAWLHGGDWRSGGCILWRWRYGQSMAVLKDQILRFILRKPWNICFWL